MMTTCLMSAVFETFTSNSLTNSFLLKITLVDAVHERKDSKNSRVIKLNTSEPVSRL